MKETDQAVNRQYMKVLTHPSWLLSAYEVLGLKMYILTKYTYLSDFNYALYFMLFIMKITEAVFCC